MKNVVKDRVIRVGVLGADRGRSLAHNAKLSGMELVAVCDNFPARLEKAVKDMGVVGYADFDEFLKHDMDAVIIANCFHQHAPFAMKAMRAGLHVLSETACNNTFREGVELYRTAKECDVVYMLAENYCYTRFNQEMKKLYEAGEIGEILYAEGEYNHPMDTSDHFRYTPGVRHWRNQGCPGYYITHAISPLMYITGTVPREVSGSRLPGKKPGTKGGYVALVRMSNGAIFRLFAGVAGHSCAYELHGSCGAMESVHGHGYFGPQTLRVWHEPWDLKEGQVEEKVYLPNWPGSRELANAAGHGGGDFFVEVKFAEAIREGKQPDLDAYHGIMASNVGILIWRSIHQNGKFLRVPDLLDEKDCEEMLEDNWTPYDGVENSRLYPYEMLNRHAIPDEQIPIAREAWAKQGYTEAEIDDMVADNEKLKLEIAEMKADYEARMKAKEEAEKK